MGATVEVLLCGSINPPSWHRHIMAPDKSYECCAEYAFPQFYFSVVHSFSLSQCFTQPIFAWMINSNCPLLTRPDKPDECGSAAGARTTTCQQSTEMTWTKLFLIFFRFYTESGWLVSCGPSLNLASLNVLAPSRQSVTNIRAECKDDECIIEVLFAVSHLNIKEN